MDRLREQLEGLADKLDASKKVPGKNIAAILRALLVANPPDSTMGEAGTRPEGQPASSPKGE